MTINIDTMPIAKSLGFTATQATNQIKKNASSFGWWIGELSDLTLAQRKAYYIEVFNFLTDEEPQNCGNSYDIARRIGIPEPWVSAIIADIKAGVLDAKVKGDI